MTVVFETDQQPNDSTTLQLDQNDGEVIRSLIVREAGSFNRYLSMIDMKQTNVFNYLSGRNRISIKVLQKLLAGTNLELRCSLSIQILKDDGSTVKIADSMSLEEMLYSTEQEQSETD